MERRITLAYGEDEAQMTRDVLEAAGLAAAIPAGAKIGIKPNLVLARPCEEGATTSPRIVAALVEYLQSHGHRNLLILEGAWVGDSTARAFKVCGYEEISRRYGVPLLDTKKDAYRRAEAGGLAMEVSRTALELDFLINVPVLKGHCQTLVTGALKNLKGCLSDAEKRRFHTLGLHRPIACLNKALKTHFVLVDGMRGDLDFEEGGNPVPMHRVFCGWDPVQVDAYIAAAMGYGAAEVEYLGRAEALGVGRAAFSEAEVHTLYAPKAPMAPARPGGKVGRLAGYVQQKDACSACYANLIRALARLEERGLARYYKDQPVCVGQGFQGEAGTGPGVGRCTAGLDLNLPGCPPPTGAMLAFLEDLARQEVASGR